jgi:small-conductance mechanosensitive channel
VLKGLDGVDTVLPNEMLISSVVQNQSLSSRHIRGSTVLTVAYGSDLDVVIPLLQSVAAGVPRVLEAPAPAVSLNSFKPEGFELELGFWIVDPESGKGGVVSEINQRIYRLVEAGDIKLAKTGLTAEQVDKQIAAALVNISQTVTN